eukprot:scaffold1786_cov398-Prasinococcus_capsulatus_cf.AAC.3
MSSPAWLELDSESLPRPEATTDEEIDKLPLTRDLLLYYRDRAVRVEEDRHEALQALETLAVKQEDLHRAEWEAAQRATEVKELQKALSDAHAFLYEERERLLKLQAENDELKIREVGDRQRIQHLLKLTQPTLHESLYPRTTSSIPKPVGNQSTGVSRPSASGLKAMRAEASPPWAQQDAEDSGRVLRDVYLPTEKADSLQLKVESLQSQLSETRSFMQERVGALLKDRERRDKQEDLRAQEAAADLGHLQKKLKEKEVLLQTVTSELLTLKHTHLKETRELTEEVHRLRTDVEMTTAQVEVMERTKQLLLQSLPEQVDLIRKFEPALKRKVQLERRKQKLIAEKKARERMLRAAFENQKRDVSEELASKAKELEGEARRRATRQAHAWQQEQDDKSRSRVKDMSEHIVSKAKTDLDELNLSDAEQRLASLREEAAHAVTVHADRAAALAHELDATVAEQVTAARNVEALRQELEQAKAAAPLNERDASSQVSTLEGQLEEAKSVSARGALTAQQIPELERQLAQAKQGYEEVAGGHAASSYALDTISNFNKLQDSLAEAHAAMAAASASVARQNELAKSLQSAREALQYSRTAEGRTAHDVAIADIGRLEDQLRAAEEYADTANDRVRQLETMVAEGNASVAEAVNARDDQEKQLQDKMETLRSRAHQIKENENESLKGVVQKLEREIKKHATMAEKSQHEKRFKEQMRRLKPELDKIEMEMRMRFADLQKQHERDLIKLGNELSSDSEVVALDEELSEVCPKVETLAVAIEERLKSQRQEHISDSVEQIKSREKDIAQLEDIFVATRSQYEQRIESLEVELESLQMKHRALERRRRLDIEGFTNDISHMRKKVVAVDRKLLQARLEDRLEDDERLDSLLEAMEKRSQAEGVALSGVGPEDSSPAEMLEELLEISDGLGRMEERLRQAQQQSVTSHRTKLEQEH